MLKQQGLLTTSLPRGRINPDAGVVELVDSVDLGDVTSGKVFRFRCSRKTEYAGMMKLVNIQDLGDVPLGKVFPVPLDFLRVIL